jgi:hypothetical protein
MPVTFVSEDQNIDPNTGALVDVFVLTYTPEAHPGSFTVDAPKSPEAVSVAQANVNALNQTLDELYAIQ